ncbi:hypothetical protein DSECCO2_564120 [anaerobic digester metagenome]
MLGLDMNIRLDSELSDARGLYKEILTSIYHGEKVEPKKLLNFNRMIVRLLAIQELNENQLETRDIFVHKFIALIDIIESFNDIE